MKIPKIRYKLIMALMAIFTLAGLFSSIQEVEAATYTDGCNVKDIHDITGELVDAGIIYQSSFVPSDDYKDGSFYRTTIYNDDWTVYGCHNTIQDGRIYELILNWDSDYIHVANKSGQAAVDYLNAIWGGMYKPEDPCGPGHYPIFYAEKEGGEHGNWVGGGRSFIRLWGFKENGHYYITSFLEQTKCTSGMDTGASGQNNDDLGYFGYSNYRASQDGYRYWGGDGWDGGKWIGGWDSTCPGHDIKVTVNFDENIEKAIIYNGSDETNPYTTIATSGGTWIAPNEGTYWIKYYLKSGYRIKSIKYNNNSGTYTANPDDFSVNRTTKDRTIWGYSEPDNYKQTIHYYFETKESTDKTNLGNYTEDTSLKAEPEIQYNTDWTPTQLASDKIEAGYEFHGAYTVDNNGNKNAVDKITIKGENTINIYYSWKRANVDIDNVLGNDKSTIAKTSDTMNKRGKFKVTVKRGKNSNTSDYVEDWCKELKYCDKVSIYVANGVRGYQFTGRVFKQAYNGGTYDLDNHSLVNVNSNTEFDVGASGAIITLVYEKGVGLMQYMSGAKDFTDTSILNNS